MEKGFVGIDLGTSAVKLLLMDERGHILKTVSKEYPISFPKPKASASAGRCTGLWYWTRMTK